jgi:hypothetical protein
LESAAFESTGCRNNAAGRSARRALRPGAGG